MRAYCVLFHRYVGLLLAGFLLLAGLTGTVLAWNDALEAAVSPQLFTPMPPVAEAQRLDPLLLRERALALRPQAQINFVLLWPHTDRSAVFYLEGRPDPATGVVADLPNDELYLHPASGALMGERRWGDIRQGWVNLLPFIYVLHQKLALGVVGSYVFGVVALLWTLDCFVGAYLSFPLRLKKTAANAKARRSWLARWWPSWRVRWGGGAYKLTMDVHRAGGLWVWAMLLVLAWSGVAFNLTEVYSPAMKLFFSNNQQEQNPPQQAVPLPQPPIGWFEARSRGRQLMAQEATRLGFRVDAEFSIGYEPGTGWYRYAVHSDRDVRSHQGITAVYFDARTGAWQYTYMPTGQYAGDTITSWIMALHMARVGGWPMQLFLAGMGLLVAVLSITGVVVWLKKRRARQARRSVSTGHASLE